MTSLRSLGVTVVLAASTLIVPAVPTASADYEARFLEVVDPTAVSTVVDQGARLEVAATVRNTTATKQAPSRVVVYLRKPSGTAFVLSKKVPANKAGKSTKVSLTG